MRSLSATELLGVWERSLAQPPTHQALAVLAAACPDSSWKELAELPIGQRDRGLLSLREVLFGSQLTMVSRCPACGEPLEFALRVSDLQGHDVQAPPGRSWAMDVEGYSVTFRLPASCDLLALPPGEGPATLRHRLLARCVLDARDASGEKVSAELLPSHVAAAIAREMAVADPGADVELDLTCPACEHRWQAVFDIAGFLWKEIQAWAQRALRDVHCLARAYGWREADVLALTPTRRQIYMELSRQ
jgi:hypothetical protein